MSELHLLFSKIYILVILAQLFYVSDLLSMACSTKILLKFTKSNPSIECLSHSVNKSDEIPLEDLGRYLVDLDKKILRMLILPEKGRGEELLDKLDDFWKNFRYLDGLVVLNDQRAFRPAKEVMESECPSFVEETFDMTNMKTIYNWKSAKYSTFKEYLLIIAGLSQKFQNDFAKMKIDLDTLFERPYNNDKNNNY